MSDVSKQIYSYVAGKINYLATMPGDGPQKAALANLRRGVGKKPGDLPELWGLFLSDLPENLQNQSTEASRSEWAIYAALTLFALHQQGRDIRTDCMHKTGTRLGKAIRQLIPYGDADAEKRVVSRFNQLATSVDMLEISHYLRGMVQLLRSEDIALDYPSLACDLYWFQFPEFISNVRLGWGQDLYYIPKTESSEGDKNE